MLANSTVLLIRHAEDPQLGPQLRCQAPEKPKADPTLSSLGNARAQGYATFFQNLPSPNCNGATWKPDFLFAAQCTDHSHRPELTLQPLADSLQLQIDGRYSAGDEKTAPEDEKLARHLLRSPKFASKNIIICWHHKHILRLANCLLGDCHQPPPDAPWPKKWPDCVYGWVLWISYDENGSGTARCYR